MSIHVEIVIIVTMNKKFIVKKEQLKPLMGWMMMVLLQKEDIPAILLSLKGKYSLIYNILFLHFPIDAKSLNVGSYCSHLHSIYI